MEANLFNQIKSNKTRLIDAALYLFSILFLVSILCYAIIALKVYYQNKAMDDLNAKIAVYGTSQQKAAQNEVLDYKKKIEDYSTIIKNHTISSNVFTFLQENTLPNVWFSSFTMSQSQQELDISGEADDMATLGRQVKIFEQSTDYVKSTTLVSSQASAKGKIRFVLTIILNPRIFDYRTQVLPPSLSVLPAS